MTIPKPIKLMTKEIRENKIMHKDCKQEALHICLHVYTAWKDEEEEIERLEAIEPRDVDSMDLPDVLKDLFRGK